MLSLVTLAGRILFAGGGALLNYVNFKTPL